MMPRVSELRKLLFSLDIDQQNALVIFPVKTSTISGINIFAECDRSTPIKNFTDRLSLGELKVDDR